MIDRGQCPRLLRFGTFELDPSSNELRRAGALVKIQSQHFQLLVLLAERAGQVVTREEIRQALWDNQTFVDFDRSINFCINQIRAALDDDPQSPRFIETLPRKGYRFIAPVSTEARADEARDQEAAANRLPLARWVLLGAMLLAALGLLALNTGGWRNRLLRKPAVKPIQSLAVLPLENLSHDPEQEYFADGMTDELITALAKISALRVLSRTSVMQYRGTKKSLPEIARELNVDALVEGTVLRDRDRVRITAQLVRASPEEHLWAEKYEGNLKEVLDLQDTVAQAVAHSIRVKVTPQERTALATTRSVNAEAYESYLKGRYCVATGHVEDLERCRDYFQEAIDKEPGYALAWADLASTYNALGFYGILPRTKVYPLAKAAAEKSLELDHNLTDPLVTLAREKTEYEWDWAGAEQLFKRAIDLNPNYAWAHQNYAVYLAEVGRQPEAVSEAQRARELDPMTHLFTTNVAMFHYVSHQYDKAEQECRNSVDLAPNIAWGHNCLGSVYLETGRKQEAIAEFRKALALSDRSKMEMTYLAHALAVSGQRTEAQKLLDEMKDTYARKYFPAEYIAVVYEGLGDRDRAFEWFEKGFRERSMHSWIFFDPRQDPFRSDPRFKSLMRRMGLPQ